MKKFTTQGWKNIEVYKKILLPKNYMINYQNAGTPVTAVEANNRIKLNWIKNLESNKNNINNFDNDKNIYTLKKENTNSQLQKTSKGILSILYLWAKIKLNMGILMKYYMVSINIHIKR